MRYQNEYQSEVFRPPPRVDCSSYTPVSAKPDFWLFGPPANLVHGTAFLLPFFLGTLIAGVLLFGIARSHSLAVKRICGFALVMAWAAFGFIAYAPGA